MTRYALPHGAKGKHCDEPFTSGDPLTVADFARQITRSHGLNPGDPAEEFYKLALDCSLDADDARSIRGQCQESAAFAMNPFEPSSHHSLNISYAF
jgi:hypothetical protein